MKPSFFSIKTFLNLHPNWGVMQINVKNVLNNIFQIVIFKELQDAESSLVNIVLFTKLSYGAHFSL
jgi:hypothetical protein